MDVATAYDNLGRVLTRSGNSQTLTTTWDALGRMVSEVGPLGTMAYQYDLAGRRTRLTWPDSTYVTYEQDLYGGLTAIKNSGGSTLVGYGYNDLGQTTSISRAAGGSTSQGYDSWYRLSSLSHDLTGSGADVTFGYSYNPAGQISQRTTSNPAYVATPAAGSDGYSVNGRNQYTAVDGTTPTYDANQNATSMLGQSFGYDALNQLTSAGSNTFAFDPAMRLYRSIGSADTRFVYDGVVAAAEYNGSGTLTRRHVTGRGLETALTYDGSATQYLVTDERGSVIALADGSGVTVNSYDEFGTPGSGNAGRFQYTGQMWLPEAGLYHYRARAYMPQVGRFLQTDPIGYQDGLNLYAYVGNDPVNFTDPFGLKESGICLVSSDFGPINYANGEAMPWCSPQVPLSPNGGSGLGPDDLIYLGGGGMGSDQAARFTHDVLGWIDRAASSASSGLDAARPWLGDAGEQAARRLGPSATAVSVVLAMSEGHAHVVAGRRTIGEAMLEQSSASAGGAIGTVGGALLGLAAGAAVTDGNPVGAAVGSAILGVAGGQIGQDIGRGTAGFIIGGGRALGGWVSTMSAQANAWVNYQARSATWSTR